MINQNALTTKGSRDWNALEIFFISPIVSYFYALKNIQRKESGLAIIFICGFVGYLMNTEMEGFDLYRYLKMLHNSQSLNAVIDSFRAGKETDLYAPLSISLIGSFTKNGHILMLWFGLIFGYLYSKGLSRFNDSSTLLSYVFIIIFANIIGISGLAGVRFSTAIYVFFIGLTGYLERKDKKNVLILLSSSLFHFGLLPGVVIFFGYMLLKRWPIIIYTLAIASFISTFINFDQYMANVAGILGGSFQSRAEIYTTANTWYVEYLKENSMQTAWFIKYKFDAAYYSIVIFFIYVALCVKRLKIEENTFQLFLFILLWLTFRNLVSNVPDLGVRYTNALIAFSVFFAYKVYIDNIDRDGIINIMSSVVLIGCSLCAIYVFRCIFYYISVVDFSITPIWGISNQFLS